MNKHSYSSFIHYLFCIFIDGIINTILEILKENKTLIFFKKKKKKLCNNLNKNKEFNKVIF